MNAMETDIVNKSAVSRTQKFAGQTALITGASRGIGAAAARTLASYGANVVLLARDAESLAGVANDIETLGGKSILFAGDVTNYAHLQNAVELARGRFGALDIVVNNAGTIGEIARLENTDASDWARVIEVNVSGVFHGTRAAISQMRKQGSGVIINLSSGAATSVLEGWSHYCSSKAAVKKFTECAHEELCASGIRVVGLSPGTVATDMMQRIRDSQINPVSKIPWDAHATPQWAAEAIAYLCTAEAAQHGGTDFSIKTDAGRREVEAFVARNVSGPLQKERTSP